MDFRLKVFYTVAVRLNFTKAAAELYISQPAVTKHIQEIEEQYKVKLFERNGSKIALTKAGQVLLKYAKAIFKIYRDIDYELSAFNLDRQGTLRLGASTTIAQYVISPLLASFHQNQQQLNISLINGNTEQIETALLQKEIEVGIVEGQSKSQSIKYIPFLKDELVLVTRTSNSVIKQAQLGVTDLTKQKFITRERGSGTLEVIEHALKAHQIKWSDLQIEMQLGSTEGIKSYLLNSDCVAFISVHAIVDELKHNELMILDVLNLEIERYFYLITLQGDADPLTDLFIKKVANHYNLKL